MGELYLRTFNHSDIEDYVLWNTKEIEWQKWNGPWEDLAFDEFEYRQKMANYNQSLYTVHKIETRLEICLDNGEHIGTVSTYFINQDYLFDNKGESIAIVINIAYIAKRKKGYDEEVLNLYIEYLRVNSFSNIYAQTWSGNYPTIKLASELGLEENCRKLDYRVVNNQYYDGLIIVLRSIR